MGKKEAVEDDFEPFQPLTPEAGRAPQTQDDFVPFNPQAPQQPAASFDGDNGYGRHFDSKVGQYRYDKPQGLSPGFWWQAIKDSFAAKDPESKAMFETLRTPGAVVGGAGLEAVKRLASGGKEGLGDWKDRTSGNGPGTPEALQKKFGMGTVPSWLIGLPYDTLTDPFASFIGPAAKGTNPANLAPQALGGLFEKPQMGGVVSAALQKVPGTGWQEKAQSLGRLMQEGGKRIFRSPFKKVDAELVGKFRNGAVNPHAFSDELLNEGNPLVGGFSKSGPEIGEEITNLRKQAGQSIGDQIAEAGGNSTIDLAPNLESNAAEAMLEELNKSKIEEALAAGKDSGEIKELTELPKGASAVEWLKNKLASRNKDERNLGLQILTDSAPDLASVVEKNARHLSNSGSRKGVIDFYHSLIDDLMEGPRSLEELQDLKVSHAQQAARNQAMGANQYARNALPNTGKTADMQAAEQLGSVIDGIVEDAVGGSGALSKTKKTYSALRRGEVPAWRAIAQHEGRPVLSKIDMLLALGSGGKYLPAKVGHEVSRSPRLGTGLGRALIEAGKGNIWDNMVRRGLLDSTVDKEKK